MNTLSLDFLIRLKNAYIAGKKSITAPSSKYVIALAKLIEKHSFIEKFNVEELPNKSQQLKVTLKYTKRLPAISNVKIYSKPGRRMYCDSITIPWGIEPKSLVIISTSKGVLSQKQAQKNKIGGELVAQIW